MTGRLGATHNVPVLNSFAIKNSDEGIALMSTLRLGIQTGG